MATYPSNTFATFAAKGNREDLSDVIYLTDPYDTPFITGIPRADATAVTHTWQTQSLASASNSNFVGEGADATTDSTTATTELSNTCGISDKVPRVSGTQQAVVGAGRRDELAFQVTLKTLELRRDMESILLANNAEATGGTNTAREPGGIESSLNTNTDLGATGSAGSLGNTARTNGTNRALTEDLVKTVLKGCWDNGGDPDTIMVGSFNKQKISADITGNATKVIDAQTEKVVAGVDIYVSDFGQLSVIPNRFQTAESTLILQMDMFATAYLRPVHIKDLALTGDSDRKQILAEYTLESRNEQASGAVFDCSTS